MRNLSIITAAILLSLPTHSQGATLWETTPIDTESWAAGILFDQSLAAYVPLEGTQQISSVSLLLRLQFANSRHRVAIYGDASLPSGSPLFVSDFSAPAGDDPEWTYLPRDDWDTFALNDFVVTGPIWVVFEAPRDGVLYSSSPALAGYQNSDLIAYYNDANGRWKRGERPFVFKIEGISVEGPSPVPEPATWVMMIGGFGIAGVAVRHRRVGASIA